MEQTVDIVKRSTSPENFWWDVFIDGELAHEHLDREQLDALGLKQSKSYRPRRVR